MRAILVDDERLSLQYLKKMLECDVGTVEVVGAYSDPYQVLENARMLQPDAAFLDIHMPEIDGLRLGAQLQKSVPGIQLVFVTGYEHCALEAFELHALDYIMKPVRLERLKQTVSRLKEREAGDQERFSEPEPPVLCCFNKLRYQWPGQAPEAIEWRSDKAEELFAYLLHHRNRVAGTSELIQLLWPELEPSRAAQQLYIMLDHVREALRSSPLDGVTLTCGDSEGGCMLSIGNVRLETEEWERKLKQLGDLTVQSLADYEDVLKRYAGHYHANPDYVWARQEQERLKRLWLEHAGRLSRYYVEQGDIRKAVRVQQRIQQLLPDDAASYFSLMKLYDTLGFAGSVEVQYWMLTSKKMEMDAALYRSVTEWYNRWRLRSLLQ